mgnify:CR=1 FL=1
MQKWKRLLTNHPQDEAQAMAMADLETGSDDPIIDGGDQVINGDDSRLTSPPYVNHTIDSLMTVLFTSKC